MASQVGRRMPRIQRVAIKIIRDGLPEGIKVGSWVEDVAHREMPLVNVRRIGGLPHRRRPDLLGKPVIELTAYSTATDPLYPGLTGTEDLLLDAAYLLWKAVDKQTVVPGVGYLHSYFETMGPTQFDSPFDDTWRIQGLIQLGLRPARQGDA